ncbi:RidA family protein [Flavobacteriaceae bacterium TP-CH-4]|uniref:RidA family protein n=1 Tax=Pelagihabitans pacificus TaxID=2696054 RepID=A0A967E7R6_9FLAO|nr:RidA family protein [Pelagihabitans pacificus]NHF60529.1 RidA family protein [Pelagihabitans pacificus]
MKTVAFLSMLTLCLLACNSVREDKEAMQDIVPTTVEIDESYNPEARLKALGIELQTPSTPVANYVHAVRTGNLLFLAGKGPKKADGENIVGKLGADLSLEQGYEAARTAGINQLAVLKAELGNLNKVKRIVKVKGMVNALPEFTDHSKVINGYSDLMVEVFGEKGRHARAAVGMGSLPGNMAVEVEMVVEVYD